MEHVNGEHTGESAEAVGSDEEHRGAIVLERVGKELVNPHLWDFAALHGL